MILFDWIIALLAGAVVLAGLARRIGAPPPAFLAAGGAMLALVPGGPRLELDPGLALVLFVAPALLDAAYATSLRDLRANWLALASLVVIAVGLTTVAVALVARALRPEMPLSVALVLGAVVAPPDASAAAAVMQQVRPPFRIGVILEGESMLNDAVALLIFRLASASNGLTGDDTAKTAVLGLLAVVGSVAAGVALGRVFIWLTARVTDAPSSIVLQFVAAFGVWILADRAGLSSVLTMVAYAVALSRHGSSMPARLRVPSSAVWGTVVFVLNVLAFVLIGLQVRPIVERLSPAGRSEDLRFALATLGTVIGVRIAWVLAVNTLLLWRLWRSGHGSQRELTRSFRSGLLVAWCGMRGIVTLAAAMALPLDFPQRDVIVLTAFAVVLGTLLVQGLTFKPLIVLLGVSDDGPVEREIRLGWKRGLEAALASLGEDATPEAENLRREYRVALEKLDRTDRRAELPLLPSDALRRRAVAAARRVLSELREHGEIGDDAFRTVEEELDRVEVSLERFTAAAILENRRDAPSP
jgi:CPA1 family monovalent cation:H+ antiporter